MTYPSNPPRLMLTHLVLTSTALLCLTLPGSSFAQDKTTSAMTNEPAKTQNVPIKDRPQEKLYRGIIPQKRDTLTKKGRKKRSRRASITWIGFQPQDSLTRVFVQTSGDIPEYETVRSEDGTMLTLILKNVSVKNYNVLRFIDTSFYKRAITRIDAKRHRRNLHVTLNIEPGASPSISNTDGYLYIDLPHSGS